MYISHGFLPETLLKRVKIHPVYRYCYCLIINLCPTLCNPMDCRPPGSSVHRILPARILEWVAISFSRGSSQPRDRTCVSSLVGRFFTTELPGKLIWNITVPTIFISVKPPIFGKVHIFDLENLLVYFLLAHLTKGVLWKCKIPKEGKQHLTCPWPTDMVKFQVQTWTVGV